MIRRGSDTKEITQQTKNARMYRGILYHLAGTTYRLNETICDMREHLGFFPTRGCRDILRMRECFRKIRKEYISLILL